MLHELLTIYNKVIKHAGLAHFSEPTADNQNNPFL